MAESVFTSMSSDKMAHLVATASERVIFAAPAIREKVATALVEASLRLGMEHVTVVMDCDDEVFRLGYGDFKAVETLHEHGMEIRQCSGLRVGILVCDDSAWVFAPTALYVQPDVHSDETPNAVHLTGQDIDRLMGSILPVEPDDRSDTAAAEAPEIGNAQVSEEALASTKQSLEVAPPVAFDIARQVRVFQPYIQYVDISLRGCSIQRRRVQIPKSIQKLKGKEIEDRLQTTFELIEKRSAVSSVKLEGELNQIRDNMTRSLGKPWGRIILKSVRSRFDERIDEFQKRLEEHKAKVRKEIETALEESKEQIVDHYLPSFQDEPPDALLGQLLHSTPSEEDVRYWLRDELDRVFPRAADVISEMDLDVQFRDVTYETLCEKGFFEALRNAYPRVPWDKPFDEFNAAKEKGN